MTRKPKPVRRTKPLARRRAAKLTGKSIGKSTGKSASKPDAVDTLIAASAAALALPIDPAWRANVKVHLQLTLAHAARVDEFPLPDEIEAAPVFHA
jgi:hypothetical protein